MSIWKLQKRRCSRLDKQALMVYMALCIHIFISGVVTLHVAFVMDNHAKI